MRAAIAAESAGIPSVSIVCEGFDGQASATARGHGHEGLPLAVTVGHVDAQTADERVHNFVNVTVDQVIAGLVDSDADRSGPSPTASGAVGEPAALDVVIAGGIDDVQADFIARGWTDGHPVVPPTRDRVEALLDDAGHDPWRSLGVAASSGRDVTIWSLAVNAVMAGCGRAHLPVLLAVADSLLESAYGVEHSGNTTGADALVVASGPGLAELGLTAGPGAQREGVHANTSIGRWLRLVLRNVFGFTADAHDKATFGNPARPVLVEHHDVLDEIGWPSLADEIVTETIETTDTREATTSPDALCIARMNSGNIIGSVVGATPDEMVPYLADGLVRTASWDLTHVHGLGRDQFSPLLVLSPVLARTLARAGWSKRDLRVALWDQARITANAFERYIGDWSNLTAGRPRLVDLAREGVLPEVFGASDDPDRLVPIVCRADRIRIAVAGDPHRTNAYAFSNDGPHGWWTGRRIDHSPGTDLICSIDGSCAVG
ncbi:MAG: UGSC family (seleno)protein [Actinomycetota bacterium]